MDKKQAQLEKHLEGEKWTRARKLLLAMLKKKPDSHWLLTRLSLTYYEQRNYRKALEISKKAVSIMPDCPLVMWDHAGTLNMIGKNKQAIKIYKDIVRKGSRRKTFGECWESPRWTESLVNDCRYRLGLCYRDIKNYGLAKRYLRNHLKRRRPGLPSTYPKKLVLAKLRQIDSMS